MNGIMKKYLIILMAVLVSGSVSGAREAGRYLITDFGAKADTSVLSTGAIQKAIDRCSEAGGGKVIVPAGKFKTGTIVLKDNVWLEVSLGATLYGSTRFEDYPFIPYDIVGRTTQKPNYQLILAQNVNNVGLCGEGTIDGQGGLFPKIKGSQGGHIRPILIRMVKCANVTVRDLNLRNAARWMEHYLCCDNVRITGLRIFNRSNYNNDGLDVDGCHNVVISDIICDSDDDGIVFKSTTPRLCENVSVTNCVISSHCSAIKFGTETNGGFRNFAISNCVIKPSESPERVWWGREKGLGGLTLAIADGGVMDGILINNISITGTQAPVYIRLCNRATPYDAAAPRPGVGSLRNVIISNVRATDASTMGCSITGIPGHPVENILLRDVSIEFQGGVDPEKITSEPEEWENRYPECTNFGTLPSFGFFVRHARGVKFENVTLTTTLPDHRPSIIKIDTE